MLHAKFFTFLLGLTLLMATQKIVAQENISKIQGDYEVFYSTFNASFLTPEVANATGLVRAKNIGLVNISILQHFKDGSTKAVAAKSISGSAYNLIHKETLNFIDIIEPDAIYYIGQFKINNDNEKIILSVEVTPQSDNDQTKIKPIKLDIQKQFYLN